jgi:hypothetical protein
MVVRKTWMGGGAIYEFHVAQGTFDRDNLAVVATENVSGSRAQNPHCMPRKHMQVSCITSCHPHALLGKCRSPMGEAVLRHISTGRGISLAVASCGTAGYHAGEDADDRQVVALSIKTFNDEIGSP